MVKINNIYQDEEGYYFWAYFTETDDRIFLESITEMLGDEEVGDFKVRLSDSEVTKIRERIKNANQG